MKTAIILFNLGGPDRTESVRPFLFNLFRDKAIIRLPALFRYPLAYLIARRRNKKAIDIYDMMGGGSPIVPNTDAQAQKLDEALADLGEVKSFVVMRYWHPMADEVAMNVKDYNPDRVLLLPLYPQYSTTTTASSLQDWTRAAKAAGLNVPTKTLCCYPTASGFIGAQALLIKDFLEDAQKFGRPRILFSAHGLPEKIVAAGDPYQWQCERTAEALATALGAHVPFDWVSTYQSRVGPLKWIGPSTEDEVKRAGADKVPLIIVPMAFVSEHSETLVELDIEYKHLADEHGVPYYGRVPTVSAHELFINGLAELARLVLASDRTICSQSEGRICPPQFKGCPQQAA